MERLARLFVHNPAGIFLLAGLFFAAYLFLRNSKTVAHPKALLWAATAWTIWAIWEFMILRSSPEANIRIDLLVIVPLVLLASAYGIIGCLDRLTWQRVFKSIFSDADFSRRHRRSINRVGDRRVESVRPDYSK